MCYISRLVFYLTLLAVLLGSCVPAPAQGFGPEAFGIPSNFGMSITTSTRQLGMGTMMGCVPDAQFANPAFAALQQEPNAGARVTVIDFERGPCVTCAQGHYVRPLDPDRTGLGVTLLVLSSSGGAMTLPVIGDVSVGMSEQAFVVDYGRRLSDALTVGMSVLGYQETSLSVAPPAGPLLLDVRSRADFGLRFGGAWEWAPGDYVGLIYTYAETTVDTEGLLMPALVRSKFSGDQFVAGASRHLSPDLLAAVEYQHGGACATGISSSYSTWHFGLEYGPAGPWSFRVGLADESPTLGFGYDNGPWRADYAFINDWHKSEVGALFGGSETHSVQVIGTW